MPFWKKSPSLEALPAEDRWSVFEGVHDGGPMIVRINESAKDYLGHKEMPVRLGLAVQLKAPDERGFPGVEEESGVLVVLEDALFNALRSSRVGRVV